MIVSSRTLIWLRLSDQNTVVMIFELVGLLSCSLLTSFGPLLATGLVLLPTRVNHHPKIAPPGLRPDTDLCLELVKLDMNITLPSHSHMTSTALGRITI